MTRDRRLTNEQEERLIALLPDVEEPVVATALLVIERLARDLESQGGDMAAMAPGWRDIGLALAYQTAHWRSGPLGGSDPNETFQRLAELHRKMQH
ncbi:hypothetical protein [Myxococcus vastator]|uniref:hypothetical protein n=1 Tax=Myxococcus vastator TaxID=2709664 RepID=UPI0013CFDAF4|nr:hypothetical protein [Myxococcus vastator]